MTQKDGSPEASEGPYWSEELLAVLVVGLGDETQARETLEGIIQQALSGRALQGISEEALASYLSNLYERIAESVRPSPRTAWARRGLSAHAPPPGQECAGEHQLLPLCPFVLVLLPCTVLFCQIRV